MVLRKIRKAKTVETRPRPAITRVHDATPCEQLVVRLPGPSLSVQGLQEAVSQVLCSRDTPPRAVTIDFSEVEEMTSPWCIQIAMLIALSRRLLLKVYGLHGQPLRAVWMLRCDPEIRSLLDLAAYRPRQSAA